MIVDTIAAWKSLKITLPAAFTTAFSWIEKNKDNPPDDGTISLGKNNFRALVQTYDWKELEGMHFENHHKFIDIQYVVQGAEAILWSKTKDVPEFEAYSDEKDIEFFDVENPVANTTSLLLEEGMFAIFWPSDWHIPCLSPAAVQSSYAGTVGPVKKFVIKVPVQ
jgi:YhcH/YjgK/YiaL family protein